MRAHPCSAALAFLAFFFSSRAGDAKPHASLERARRAIERDLEFSEGILILRAALDRGVLADAERVEANYLLAIAYSARGEQDLAAAAFTRVLELDPKFTLDDMHAPKIRDAFETARRPAFVALRARQHEESVGVDGALRDPCGLVAAVEVRWRHTEGARFEVAQASLRGASFSVELILPEPREARLELTASAKDERGRVLVESRTASIALEARSLPPPPQPLASAPAEDQAWYEHWWVWVGLGVIVAAGATTAVVLARGDEDLPTVRLP